MAMKYLLIAFLILVVACTAPPEDVPRATEPTGDEPVAGELADNEPVAISAERSMFEFEGYGPGKSHVGTFEEMSGTVTLRDGYVIAAQGVIQAASVKTDSAGLDNHLKNEDFFDVERFPTIEFSSRVVTDTMMVGTLSFHGAAKEMVIPVTQGENSLSADFVISMADFGIVYAGVNDEVRIAFDIRP